MIDFKEEIAKKIAEVVQLDKNELMQYIEIPPNAELGDYAFPCFKLAKTLRKAPPMIATEIKENNKFQRLLDEIARYSPAEIIVNENMFLCTSGI